MATTSQLDRILQQAHEGRPCAPGASLLKYPAIKRFFHPLISLVTWVIALFNPPPLELMNIPQRTGRVILMTLALVIASILFAMIGAVGLFLMEKGRELRDTPEFYHGLLVVFVGIAVNSGCIFALLQVKKADTKLLPPDDKK
jgi:hypothetical protein